jgi:hypothetical protein
MSFSKGETMLQFIKLVEGICIRVYGNQSYDHHN